MYINKGFYIRSMALILSSSTHAPIYYGTIFPKKKMTAERDPQDWLILWEKNNRQQKNTLRGSTS